MNNGHGTLRTAVRVVVGSLMRSVPPAFAGIVVIHAANIADARAAQQPPPIHGVTGTIATEGTIQQTYDGTNKILVKAADGVEHLFRLGRRSTVHGGDAAADEALGALKKGTRVVVHYTGEGENLTAEEIDRLDDEGLKQMEGTVAAVNRRDRTIVIRLADGTRQTLRLSERAAADVGKDVDAARDSTAKVIVYYRDEAGKPVAHYFKRVS